jgi:hypothetical protein
MPDFHPNSLAKKLFSGEKGKGFGFVDDRCFLLSSALLTYTLSLTHTHYLIT